MLVTTSFIFYWQLLFWYTILRKLQHFKKFTKNSTILIQISPNEWGQLHLKYALNSSATWILTLQLEFFSWSEQTNHSSIGLIQNSSELVLAIYQLHQEILYIIVTLLVQKWINEDPVVRHAQRYQSIKFSWSVVSWTRWIGFAE
jgi:hypothetical protein